MITLLSSAVQASNLMHVNMCKNANKLHLANEQLHPWALVLEIFSSEAVTHCSFFLINDAVEINLVV